MTSHRTPFLCKQENNFVEGIVIHCVTKRLIKNLNTKVVTQSWISNSLTFSGDREIIDKC